MEIVFTAFLMITMAATAVNASVFIFGFMCLDSACRDACRAAAQQTDSSHAQLAAKKQLNAHATNGVWVTQPALSNLTYTDYGGSPPVNKSPFVTTTCTLSVTPLLQTGFLGVSLANFLNNGVLQLTRTYTFPIVKTKFYS
jgi:hypothetical protein